MPKRLCVIGDVHGHAEILRQLLRDAELIAADGSWTGGAARLAVLGDLVDRGPDGIGVIDTLMRLETEAAQRGGELIVLLGNHDLLLLAASTKPELFEASWLRNGGELADRQKLAAHHVQWLQARPAIARVDDDVLVHADALLYLDSGGSIAAVNARFREVATIENSDAVEHLLDEFSRHDEFLGPDGAQRLDQFLGAFGGSRVIHGHSPICRVRDVPAEDVVEAYVYAGGRAVNVDQGLYRGGRGFFFDARPD